MLPLSKLSTLLGCGTRVQKELGSIPHAKRANVDALQQEKLRIYLLIPLIISKASFLLRVIVSCFQEDGLLDSVCLTSRCEARTLVAASSDGISH